MAGLLLGALVAIAAPVLAVAQAPSAIAKARETLEQAAGALGAAQGGRTSLAALGRAVTVHEVALAARAIPGAGTGRASRSARRPSPI